jgi:hypothetical protein
MDVLREVERLLSKMTPGEKAQLLHWVVPGNWEGKKDPQFFRAIDSNQLCPLIVIKKYKIKKFKYKYLLGKSKKDNIIK